MVLSFRLNILNAKHADKFASDTQANVSQLLSRGLRRISREMCDTYVQQGVEIRVIEPLYTYCS